MNRKNRFIIQRWKSWPIRFACDFVGNKVSIASSNQAYSPDYKPFRDRPQQQTHSRNAQCRFCVWKAATTITALGQPKAWGKYETFDPRQLPFQWWLGQSPPL